MQIRVRDVLSGMMTVNYKAVEIVELPSVQKDTKPERYILLLPKNPCKSNEIIYAHVSNFYDGDVLDIVQKMIESKDPDFMTQQGFDKWFRTAYEWLTRSDHKTHYKWIEPEPARIDISPEERCWMTGDYSDECECELCSYHSECSGYREQS